MSAYLIESLEVKELWGYRDLKIQFNRDVTILIGPNASGKTTIINLLRFILSGDVLALSDYLFDRATIKLRGFDDNSSRTIKVQSTETGFKFNVSRRPFVLDVEPLQRERRLYMARGHRLFMHRQAQELANLLKGLVPAVWLPVSRRLPIPEEEEYTTAHPRIERHAHLESVDECLRQLIEELSRYRLRLDAQLSERYKAFQKRVLEIMLYSKEHDDISSLSLGGPLTAEEKELLVRAFQEAGLLDKHMRKRIDQHFSVAEEVLNRMRKSAKDDLVDIEDLLIIPLIPRTRSMIQSAKDLETDREELFAPLRRYEDLISSFLNGKKVSVMDNGELKIESPTPRPRTLSPYRLSSGEKQILILLTQALLWEDRPVVYGADEPELSLHVSWQENLLKSLLNLAGNIQIIVATHSPDIVGPYTNKVIDLGKLG